MATVCGSGDGGVGGGELAERMEIEEAHNPELAELSRDVQPEKVIEKMEDYESGARAESQG